MDTRIPRPVWLACSALVLAGLACNSLIPAPTLIPGESPTPGCSTSQADIVLGADASGQTVSLQTGDRLAVSLGSNASTGFEWTVQSLDANMLRYDGKEYTGSLNPMPGSGGAEALCFTALIPGTSQLVLEYHRTFEVGVPPIETFEITVEVK